MDAILTAAVIGTVLLALRSGSRSGNAESNLVMAATGVQVRRGVD